MSKYSYSIERLDGGRVDTANYLELQPDESPSLSNVVFDSFGAVETVKGYKRFGNAFTDKPIDCLKAYTPLGGESRLLAISNGSLYERRLSQTQFTLVSASLFTQGISCWITIFNNVAFISNGTDESYKYNGTTVSKWGVENPTDAPTASVETYNVGVLSGSYQYAILGVNSYSAMSSYGPISDTVTPNLNTVLLTNIPVYPTIDDVQTKYICRTKADSPGLFYLVAEISNATTSYSDNIADTELTEYAPYQNDRPERFIAHVNHKGMMFGIKKNDSKLYFSDILAPETWFFSDYIDVASEDSAVCTGLVILFDNILITKADTYGNSSLFMLFTPSAESDNWSLQKLDSWVGGNAPKAFVPFDNYVMSLNKNGVYDFHQSQPGIIKPDALSFNIEKTIKQINQTYINRSTAIAYNNKLYISVPYDTSTYNNKVLVYDFVKGRNLKNREYGAWSNIDGMNVNDFVIYNDTLYAGSSTTGVVYELEQSDYLFEDAAINSYFKTFAIQGSKPHENNVKVFRTLWLLVDTTGEFPMTVEGYTDFTETQAFSTQVNLSNSKINTWDETTADSSTWDVMVWDVGTWYSDKNAFIERKLIRLSLGCQGKFIQLKFTTNTPEAHFKMHSITVDYTLKGRR